tara:strand:+ start:469 stop:786 length:318 start_codon:yes stop_codon:yes gene_type:complete
MKTLKNLENLTTLKIGDKIKTFEVKDIVFGVNKHFRNNGSSFKYKTKFYLLENPKKQHRVLEVNEEQNLNNCLMFREFWSGKLKYSQWNMIELYKEIEVITKENR